MLEPKGNYMNPYTGSVDSGENWMIDFEDRDKEEYPTWESWRGDDLIEVE